jgi:hypothetical protein
MFQSSNGQSLESVELETIRAWYTMGYLEGMLAGYTVTEPVELDNILVQPQLFIPLVEGLDQAQRTALLETFNSINIEAVGGGSGEFQRARMAKFWHYLGGLR